jgi:MinD-like ATPase involved in chromosome partitioning or flagellar assembly
MASHDMRKVVTLAMDQRNDRGIRTPLELLREIQTLDPAEGTRFVETMHAFHPRLVINDVRTADDINEYLGYVNHDESARRSVRARRPLIDVYPRSDAAIYISRIARKLLANGAAGESQEGSA